MEYERFYEDGDRFVVHLNDYTSENTDRLDLEETKQLLLTLPELAGVLAIEPETVAASTKVDA